MQRNTLRRLVLASLLGTAAALLTTPLWPTTASACGPYGPRTPEDRVHDAAAVEQYRLDPSRWIAAFGSVEIDDDHATVLLRLQDEDGRRFDRTMQLTLVEGTWEVTRVGKVRRRRRAA